MAPLAMDRMLAALLVPVAMAPFSALPAHAAQLHLDGIVKVKEFPLEGTRVIVIDREGPSTIISRDVGHFTLPLDLDRTYLLSFEREGCVTKQLLFDTRVPGPYRAEGPFSFPFQVTLEPEPPNAPFSYAGPVGFVRFYDDIHDFGYDTDYRISRDAALTERLEQVRQEQQHAGAAASAKEAIGAVPIPPANVDAPQGAFEELAPTLSEVPPLVHNTADRKVVQVNRPAPVVLPARTAVPPPSAPLAVPKLHEEVPSSVPTTPARREALVEKAATAVVDGQERTEQLIVEPRRVTTVIRLMDQGRTTEFRRVAHAYGAVFFFRNGGSCTEREFEQARAH